MLGFFLLTYPFGVIKRYNRKNQAAWTTEGKGKMAFSGVLNQFAGLLLLGTMGYLGMRLFRALRLPTPAMLGSLFMTGIFAATGTFPAVSLKWVSFFSKIAIGVMTGRRITRESARTLGHLALPALVLCFWMIVSSLISGWILYSVSKMPLSTALVGSAAGGITEMAIFALSQGYDVTTITFIQVIRLVAVLALTPYLVRYFEKKTPRTVSDVLDICLDESPLLIVQENLSPFRLVLTVGVAIACGFLLERLHFPAGAMIGAMVASGACVLFAGKQIPFSLSIRNVAQIGMGVTIASRIDPQTLFSLIEYLPGIVLSTIFIVVSTAGLGLLLAKWTGWDLTTCLLSTSAGGLSQMILVAEECNCDPLKVSVLHLARYLAIIAGMPFLISALLG